jgi:tetratricopeptide (TPR) repeat protein
MGMGKTLGVILSCMLFISAPTWGQDAVYFYNLGLENSMANRKIHYFSKALELNPRLAVAYEKRGVLYYFQGKYSEMSEDFQRLAELDPSNSEAHLMLGLAYLKRDDHDKAVETLARAIELNPRLASAYGHRAEAYRLEGMVDEAIQDSTKAIELGDTKQATSRAYTTRAKVYSELGKNELARADLSEAFRLDPSFFFYLHPSSTDS